MPPNVPSAIPTPTPSTDPQFDHIRIVLPLDLALILDDDMHFGNFLLSNFDTCLALMEKQCLLLLSSELFQHAFGHSTVYQSYLYQGRLRIIARVGDNLLPPCLPSANEIDPKGRLFSSFTAVINEVTVPATYV